MLLPLVASSLPSESPRGRGWSSLRHRGGKSRRCQGSLEGTTGAVGDEREGGSGAVGDEGGATPPKMKGERDSAAGEEGYGRCRWARSLGCQTACVGLGEVTVGEEGW
jgi:hypothetical protein